MKRFLVGVDEAGRGPLAGPVAVGLVAVPRGYSVKKHFPGVADSKKLSPKKREALFALLEAAVKRGEVSFVVEFSTAACIDRIGITRAIARALNRGLAKLTAVLPERTFEVFLDGSLYAPPQYTQKTIIRGDATESVISLASIAAKVVRDRCMVRAARRFPGYQFEVHKGYGTKAHYTVLLRQGPSTLHRKTFL